jgi:AraC family transcriptional regulator
LSRYQDRIDRVDRHIRDTLSGDLSLDVLAEVAALSRFHFHRIWAAMTGETVAEAVRRARMNRASVLVVMSNRPLSAIAREVGYPDADSFARVFRAAFGATPAQMRARGKVAPPLLPPPKGRPPMFPVEIRDLPDMTVAALPHRGAYDRIGPTFDALARQIAASPLAGHVREAVGLYYDMPGQVPDSELRAHAGLVTDGAPVPAGFDALALPGGRHAVLTVTGPFTLIPEGWAYLYGSWLPGSGEVPAERPPFELYVSDMETTPPDRMVTLICMPLA